MTHEEILNVITDNFLCVRRLPFTVVTYWNYKEGDENKKYVDSNGNPSKSIRSVVVQNYDLEYFQKTEPSKWEQRTPEKRYEEFVKRFPDGRKLLREQRDVEKGGWWYVKPIHNTSSTVQFSMEHDKFFAPTLEEAVELYLKSK